MAQFLAAFLYMSSSECILQETDIYLVIFFASFYRGESSIVALKCMHKRMKENMHYM